MWSWLNGCRVILRKTRSRIWLCVSDLVIPSSNFPRRFSRLSLVLEFTVTHDTIQSNEHKFINRTSSARLVTPASTTVACERTYRSVAMEHHAALYRTTTQNTIATTSSASSSRTVRPNAPRDSMMSGMSNVTYGADAFEGDDAISVAHFGEYASSTYGAPTFPPVPARSSSLGNSVLSQRGRMTTIHPMAHSVLPEEVPQPRDTELMEERRSRSRSFSEVEDDESEIERQREFDEAKKLRAREKGRERQRRKRERDKQAREVSQGCLYLADPTGSKICRSNAGSRGSAGHLCTTAAYSIDATATASPCHTYRCPTELSLQPSISQYAHDGHIRRVVPSRSCVSRSVHPR